MILTRHGLPGRGGIRLECLTTGHVGAYINGRFGEGLRGRVWHPIERCCGNSQRGDQVALYGRQRLYVGADAARGPKMMPRTCRPTRRGDPFPQRLMTGCRRCSAWRLRWARVLHDDGQALRPFAARCYVVSNQEDRWPSASALREARYLLGETPRFHSQEDTLVGELS